MVCVSLFCDSTSRLEVLHDGIRFDGIAYMILLLLNSRVSHIFGAFSLECTRKSVNEACDNATESEPLHVPHILV